MLDQFLGPRPRLTAYFGVLAIGLSLLAVGAEATRLRVIGTLSQSAFTGYAAVALLGGFALAFTVAYFNASLVAGWLAGAVPAAGRYGALLLEGTDPGVTSSAVGTLGVGLVLGSVGYVLATEKHRRDALAQDISAVPPRASSVALAVAAIGVGLACLVIRSSV